MSEVVLSLEGIHKYFGNSHVIHDVNLEIKRGEFVTFLGPSGCGKTTLLRMVAGFYEPDEGKILLNGKHIENLPPYKRNTAMVFQEYALFPHMNVFDNIAYGLRVQKLAKDEIQNRVTQAMALMQLEGMEMRFPNQMSGGQQQRVAVARALVMNPDVLLLDEPLSNLDAKLRETVRVELRDIQQKMNVSTIYVTHDQSEALSMSDKIVVLKKGVVHQIGTPQEIYFEPKTAFVADFIGTTNLIPVIGTGDGAVVYGEEKILVQSGVEADVCGALSVRPESILLQYEKQMEAVNIKGVVTHSMFLGEKVRYFVKDEQCKEWIVDMYDQGGYVYHGEVFLTFAPHKAWFIQEDIRSGIIK